MAEYGYRKEDFVLMLEAFGVEAARGGVYISFPGCESFYRQISTESDRRTIYPITPEEYDAIDKAFSQLGKTNRTFQTCSYMYYCVSPNRSFIGRTLKLSKHTTATAIECGFDAVYDNYRKIQGFD